MQIKSFKTTPMGDYQLKTTQAITGEEKLRLIIVPEMYEVNIERITYLEILNPFEMCVVKEKLPEFDNSKIVYFDVIIPKTWIKGKYIANVLNNLGEVVCNDSFFIEPLGTAPLIVKTLAPKWRLNYSILVRNPTKKPIGNFSAFVALPITIIPQQIVKNLQIQPSDQKISTDIEGNHWTRFEVNRFDPGEKYSMSYSAVIEMTPIIIPKNNATIVERNPYTKQFLKKYLESEPHIESDHPSIKEIASKIGKSDILTTVRKIVREVQKIVKYEIQNGEYGAAYAVETGKGDCTEFAALFVALCRALEIPARTNAGFALTNSWERHATAEFLLAGRWIPVDLTIPKGDVLLGSPHTNIIITRGNWMGGTLMKEFSYKYQVMDSSQKLDVQIQWNIFPENNIQKKPQQMNSTITILEPINSNIIKLKTTVLESNKIRILDEEETKKTEVIQLTRKKIMKNNKQGKLLELSVDIPDAIKRNTYFKPEISIINNSQNEITGTLEIREKQDEVLLLRSIIGKKVAANSQEKLRPKLKLDFTGTTTLDFVFSNRIGRSLVRLEHAVTIY